MPCRAAVLVLGSKEREAEHAGRPSAQARGGTPCVGSVCFASPCHRRGLSSTAHPCCSLQGLRNRLPPSSDGLLHGESQRQFTARHLFLPLPLLLAPFLTYKYLWDAGLACFLHCLCCRLRGGAGSTGRAGSGSLGSASPGGCSPGGGAQHAVLFDPSVPVAFPAMLPAAAILAGMVSLGAALGISTCVIIPNQVKAGLGGRRGFTGRVSVWVAPLCSALAAKDSAEAPAAFLTRKCCAALCSAVW